MLEKVVHIGVCGIGLGHADRCRVIAERLIARGFEVSFSSYGDGYSYLSSMGYRVNSVPEVGYGLSRGEVSIKATVRRNIFLPITVMHQTSIETRIIEELDPDIVISDTRASTIMACKALNRPCVLLINQYRVLVNDDRWPRLANLFEDVSSSLIEVVWLMSDAILVADYPEPLTISEANLTMRDEAKRKATFIGPIIDKAIDEYPPQEDIKRKLGLKPDIPLVFIHVTGPVVERERMASIVLESLPELKDYQVICTLGKVGGRSVYRGGSYTVLDWVEDVYEYIAAADVVVSRAGQTTLAKSLAFGKKLVVIPIPRHTEQESNAASLMRKNVALVLKEREARPERLRSAIAEALDGLDEGKLNQYREMGKTLKGGDKVVQILLNTFLR